MKIKKLEWYTISYKVSWASTAMIGFDAYIKPIEGAWGLYCLPGDDFKSEERVFLGEFPTLEKVKAAAQVYYEDKIKEHLEYED